MGWLSGLFSKSDIVKDVFDKDNGLLEQAGNWIGNMSYTDEEKAEANAKLNDGVAEFVKSTLSENTVRSKTRRSIAKVWIFSELIIVFATMAAAPFDVALAKFYWSIATSELMFWGTMAVLSFFFGSYMLNQRLGISKPKK